MASVVVEGGISIIIPGIWRFICVARRSPGMIFAQALGYVDLLTTYYTTTVVPLLYADSKS